MYAFMCAVCGLVCVCMPTRQPDRVYAYVCVVCMFYMTVYVCMCMPVCVLYMSVYAFVDKCYYGWLCLWMFVCACVIVYVYMCVHGCICMYVYTHMCVFMLMYACMHVRMHY